MQPLSPLIEILINNTERILDQNEKINERLNQNNIILADLTKTVILHEKRSTTLEETQKDCRIKCEADISVATGMATAAQKTYDEIKYLFKVLFWLIASMAGMVGFAAGVAQIWDVWLKP